MSLGVEFEKAVRLLVKYLPVSEEGSRKPILFHNLRVGVYLYENNYSRDIVLAGLLHDALEWSGFDEESLEHEFGFEVLRLVKANTKDDSIIDRVQKTKELIRRCIDSGQEAMVIKAADVLDSFKWYSAQNNLGEIDYCLRNTKEFLNYRPENFNDKIFDELKKWQEKFL